MTSPGLSAAVTPSSSEPCLSVAPVRGPLPAVRSGVLPALADGFTSRPQSAPGLSVLVPGVAVALVNAASVSEQTAVSCGKTQLAAHFAETLWRAGNVDVLAWIDASSRASALSGLVRAAAAAHLGTTGSAEQVAARLTDWLAGTSWPWLMVLDDLKDAADLDGIWPRGPAGRVLITSRDENTVTDEPGPPGVRVCPVGAFSTREAVSYLSARLDPGQRHGAIDLAIELGGDPVALAHASAVIATTDESCRDYQRRYASELAHQTARHGDAKPPAPAEVTWLLSASRADQLCPGGATKPLLAISALLDGQPVPARLLTAPAVLRYLAQSGVTAATGKHVGDAVRALDDTGLVALAAATERHVVRMNRQVAELARSAMPAPVMEQAALAAADALLEMRPQPAPLSQLAATVRSCAEALQRTAPGGLQSAGTPHPLLLHAGHALDAARLTGPAVRYWTQLATTSGHILGPDHPHTLTTASHLAKALQAAGKAADAVTWWRWVTAGRARVNGPDHPGTLEARVNLGQAMTAAGQHQDAIALLQQTAVARERICGPGHPDTYAARDELAAACQAAGRTGQAVRYRQRILADLERIHGPRNLTAITARDRLAATWLAAGQPDKATSCYKQALADWQRTQGADHPATITTRRALAAAYQAAGRFAAAIQTHDQTCADSVRVLGAAHPDTLARQADLASTYRAAGRLTDAATVLRDALSRCEQALPPGHPLTQTVRHALADLAAQ